MKSFVVDREGMEVGCGSLVTGAMSPDEEAATKQPICLRAFPRACRRDLDRLWIQKEILDAVR